MIVFFLLILNISINLQVKVMQRWIDCFLVLRDK